MKYFIICPENHVTGGTEALHQLADGLTVVGQQARICYARQGKAGIVLVDSDTPHPFCEYVAIKGEFEDISDAIVIVPETMVAFARNVRQAKIIIWWLSVDFYLGRDGENWLVDRFRYCKKLITGEITWWPKLRHFTHAAQSKYATEYLREHGIESFPLSDYINRSFSVNASQRQLRHPRVLFNPRKGLSRSRKIISLLGETVDFIPLVGLSRQELYALLAESMVYMDFGLHPGKDRLPREAAISGCVVLANRRGSANFREDLPIDDIFKIDDRQIGFEDAAAKRILEVLKNFKSYLEGQQTLRDAIFNEREKFLNEIRVIAEHFSPDLQ
jgi:hypothetical protein